MKSIVRRALHCYGARWAKLLRVGVDVAIGITAPENDNAWADASRYAEMRAWFGAR